MGDFSFIIGKDWAKSGFKILFNAYYADTIFANCYVIFWFFITYKFNANT